MLSSSRLLRGGAEVDCCLAFLCAENPPKSKKEKRKKTKKKTIKLN